MRFLRSLILAGLLVFGVARTTAQQEPKPVVEYNIAACGGDNFTVIHAVLNEDKTKITFGDMLSSPTEVKKVDTPLVFDYKEEAKNEQGVIKYSASTVYEKKNLEVFGARLGNRIIGIMTVDGHLGHLYYGFIGPEVDITVGVKDSEEACNQLRGASQEDMVGLLQFLFGAAVEPIQTDKS